jgi:type II secretory pathway pseudopilin PulG
MIEYIIIIGILLAGIYIVIKQYINRRKEEHNNIKSK